MAKVRKHKHDWKLAGYGKRLPQFPGMITGKLVVCARPGCTAMQLGFLKPDPDYVPAPSGRPREVLRWIEERL